MDFSQWIQNMLRHHPARPGDLTPEERQAFTQGVMQRVRAQAAQSQSIAQRSWSWKWALPRLAVGMATASLIFGIIWYQRPELSQPDTILASSRDLEVLLAFDALNENAMPAELELLVDEVEEMQWMLLAERTTSNDRQRIEQTLEVLDAFDELDLPADEMEELWREELEWIEEELDADDANARLPVLLS